MKPQKLARLERAEAEERDSSKSLREAASQPLTTLTTGLGSAMANLSSEVGQSMVERCNTAATEGAAIHSTGSAGRRLPLHHPWDAASSPTLCRVSLARS